MGKAKELIEKVENAICTEMAKGIENVDTKEMSEVIDIYKDLYMAHYYCEITKAMEEGAEYGTDYDYMGRKEYSEPYRSRKYPGDFYTNRDMDYPKKMYYTEPMTSNDENEFDKTQKTYIELKRLHGMNSDEMDTLEDFMSALEDDMMDLHSNMTVAEKQMVRNKLQYIMDKMH